MEIANGTEGGVKYRCWYSSDMTWSVSVTDAKGKTETETFRAVHEPRCGPDVSDVAVFEKIVDRMIGRANKRPDSDHIGDANDMISKRPNDGGGDV